MKDIDMLESQLKEVFQENITVEKAFNELSLIVANKNLLDIAEVLKTKNNFLFESLMDLCGVDYLHYGIPEWNVNTASQEGFERGRQHQAISEKWDKPRFAVVYHLLSVTLNHRVRVKVFAESENANDPAVFSVHNIWPNAVWYEREAFDLLGIHFEGNPDLRRLLTDYDFEHHPFRKDFPVMGYEEVRYDAAQGKVIYEPNALEATPSVPKTIRD